MRRARRLWNDAVSKEAVALAHQRGLKVWVYTINDPAQANKLLDMGVDGLITNNTGLIWRTLALRFAESAERRSSNRTVE